MPFKSTLEFIFPPLGYTTYSIDIDLNKEYTRTSRYYACKKHTKATLSTHGKSEMNETKQQIEMFLCFVSIEFE